MIWPDPAENKGGVATVEPAGDLWPHQVRSWKYWSGGWRSGTQLSVTGKILIIIFSALIIINTKLLERHPGYPEKLTVKDQTGDRANLAGVYRREADIPAFAPPVWKYGDYHLSFNGKY